ncbi:MAG: electron transfer flavoprotein subunit alpha/FixB family protein [Chloroflexi bacterium]|nr:electron transfer flavoprotein subunit alpha/FixB family protein [Chloroflexota bacterium]
MSAYRSVMLFGEIANSSLASITRELLGAGRKLANDLGEELFIVFLGNGIGNIGSEAIALGADKVYVVDDPLLGDYRTDPYVTVMEKLTKEAVPQILLLGQTAIGRDLAPRLAFRLGTGLSTDCVELSIDPESKLLMQVRPVYGGNALAAMVCEKARPQMATIRPKAMAPAVKNDSHHGEVVSVPAGLDSSQIRTRILRKVKQEAEGIKLEDAEVVVCGGRGIGSAENFKSLEELARILGGAVGATRAASDSGWVPATIQIGLTGKIVTPNLYLAVGLSGSSQHMAGCSGSKTIVAINKDPEAPIFKAAHFGIVGDYKQVVPTLTEKCRELMAK